MTRALKLVPTPAEPPIDVHALQRADILKRDWGSVMVAADRSKPVEIIDRVRRTWRA